MKKILSLFALVLLSCMGAWADVVPELAGKVVKSVGEKTQTIDSDKWYVLSGCRKDGGNYITPTPIYDQGAGSALKREATANTVAASLPVGAQADAVAKYLVRFVAGDSNIPSSKKIQFATGNYVAPLTSQNNSTQVMTQASADNAADLFVYGATNSETTYGGVGVAINFANNDASFGKRWDGNGQDAVILVWDSGLITSDKNNVWFLQEVTMGYPTFPEAGTYFVTFTGQATDRDTKCLYNDLTYSDGFTLQSASREDPAPNNYVWKVVSDGNGNFTSMVNGQGGTYAMKLRSGSNPTINSLQYEAHNSFYYLKTNAAGITSGHNCLNQSKTSDYQNAAGVMAVTTWDYTQQSGNAADNLWAVDAIDMTSLHEYSVTVTGAEGGYAIYNGTQYAADHGFFLASSIAEGDLTAADVDGYEKSVSIEGYNITVTYSRLAPDWAGLEAIVAEAEAIPYGDLLGQYSNPSFAGELGEAQSMLTMHQNGTDAGIDQVDEAISNLRTAINNLTLNMPAAGSFIRLKGGVSNEYADANAQADQTNRSERVGMSSDATGAGSIWYLDDSKHLINFAKGYYITNTCDHSGTADNAAVFSFRESDRTIGRYGVYTSGARLYDNGAPANRNCLDRQGGAANETENWILEEVTTLPVTLTEVDGLAYASFNAPVPVKVAEGVKAYSATRNDNVLELTEFTGNFLAANTPVILTAEAAGTYNFNIVASGTTIDDNDLQGTVAKQDVAAGKTTYVLNMHKEDKNNIGFYQSKTFINGFKAYCEVDTPASSNILSLRFDDIITAISAIQSENSGAEIFDLQGRRLNKAQKGMNIINGHKVLVK